MTLFASGNFTLHSGAQSNFLIDCNALSDDDLTAIAARLAYRLPHFGSVVGIPRGGLRIAAALQKHVSDGAPLILIADDVFTTGASMEDARTRAPNSIGAVIFARTPPPLYVTALFHMDG
jgi:orotate phosphoribosyltransferase